MRSLILLIYLTCLGVINFGVNAQSLSPKAIEKLSEKLQAFEKEATPGFSLVVLKNNTKVYEKNTGLTELKNSQPINKNTIFRVASISKQFTAACILILEEKGLLSLDDALSQYFPEFPDYATQITLRDLIHHTSGIRDFFKLANLSGYEEEDFNSNQVVLELISRQKKLNFKPGTDMLYNNSGYFLLGVIVQKVSGKSINKFAEEFIFKPLGMHNTGFYTNDIIVKENKASGHRKTSGKQVAYETFDSELEISGDGGLFSTTEDLIKWDKNFLNNQLPIQNFAARMYKRGRLNNGELLNYAFGLEHSKFMDYDCISHSGAYVGFRAAMLRIPSKNLSVICLGNSAEIQATQICEKVAEIILNGELTLSFDAVKESDLPFERSSIKLKPIAFEAYKGNFELANGQVLNFYQESDRFFVDIIGQTKIEIYPASIQNFFVKETDITFTFINENLAKANMVILQLGDKRLLAKRIGQQDTEFTQKLSEYVGAYYNEDLNVTYKLIFEQGDLFIQINNKPKKAIDLIRKDRMILGQGLAEFQRDKFGNVSAFYLEAGSVKDLLFLKK